MCEGADHLEVLGKYVQVSLTIHVRPADLLLTTPVLPNGKLGTPYAVQLQATGGARPYHWSVVDGALPAGFQLNAESGAVTSNGARAAYGTFTIEVRDASGDSARRAFSITTDPVVRTIAGAGPRSLGLLAHDPIVDGGPAAKAWLNYPTDVATDGAGNTYVWDSFASRLRKISSDGIMTTIAGDQYSPSGAPITEGQDALKTNFASVHFVIDHKGGVVISDYDRNQLYRLAYDGKLHIIGGTGPLSRGFSGDGAPAVAAQFDTLNDIAIGPDNSIYIADGTRIRRIDSSGVVRTVIGDGGYIDVPSNTPPSGPIAARIPVGDVRSLAVDSHGDVYFLASRHSRARDVTPALMKVAPNGPPFWIGGNQADSASADIPVLGTDSVATDVMLDAGGIAIDGNDNLYLSGSNLSGQFPYIATVLPSGRIHVVLQSDFDWDRREIGDGGTLKNVLVGIVGGMTFDRQGNLIFSDTENNRVRRLQFNADSPLPPDAPIAPIPLNGPVVYVRPGDGSLSVESGPAGDEDYATIESMSWVITANPGGHKVVWKQGDTSPVVITGLENGTDYTVSVYGTGPLSPITEIPYC